MTNPVISNTVISNTVISNTRLAPGVHRLELYAPPIAAVRRPGQFVIVRLGGGAERIPLTIADSDTAAGTIVLVIQAVGKSTRDLVALGRGEAIHDIAGPLGRPSDLIADGTAVCVAGGVGAAVVLPIAQALSRLEATVVTVLGARTADAVLFEGEFNAFGETFVCTDDGTAGRHGLVTDALGDIVASRPVTVVYAAGPVPMMRAVVGVTRPYDVRTIVSLNPIMVDGTGMCGGCRVNVGDEMRFACVDGPEFDGFGVDFDELADRLGTYRAAEHVSAGHVCRGNG